MLSSEEVARLLAAAARGSWRAAEVLSLKVSDIDRKRMIIRVGPRRRSEQGEIPSYSDRPAARPSQTVQTVIGRVAAPRKCRPARRPTAASIGPGPTA
jgi:integrase